MIRVRQRFAFLLAGVLTIAVGLLGCAILEKENRRVLNRLDEKVQPETVQSRVALAPLMIPAGSMALAADAMVVNPISEVPDAWDDVYELYWKPRDIDAFRKSIVFVPCVLLTPPTFAGDLALRSAVGLD